MNDDELTKEFLESVKAEFRHPTLFVISFIGLPGAGKSHVARLLQKRLKVYTTSNDEIRRFLNVKGFAGISPRQELIQQIAEERTLKLYRERISHVLDADIIKFIDKFKEYAAQYDAIPYLLHIVCHEQVALQRIRTRQYEKGNFSLADIETYQARKKVHEQIDFHDHVFFTIDTTHRTEPQIERFIKKFDEDLARRRKDCLGTDMRQECGKHL